MKLTLKWVMFVALSFFGNGFISIIQKNQQMKFNGAYKSEFMIVALIIVFVIFFLLGLSVKGDKKKMLGECIKYAAPAGLANGMVNFFIMVLTSLLPTAILFPSISAMDMTFTFIIALSIFKEKLSKIQTAGYLLGVISVILLNI